MAVFRDLPAELRNAIWELCLPDPETPEIYVFDESDFKHDEDSDDDVTRDDASDSSEWEVELEVLTGFPAIMHLCAESRAFCQRRLSLRGGQLTPRTLREVDVPCRAYRPATDVFLALDFDAFGLAAEAASNAEYHARAAGVPEAARPGVFAERIGHLAVGAESFPGALGEVTVVQMTGLRKLSLVFYPLEEEKEKEDGGGGGGGVGGGGRSGWNARRNHNSSSSNNGTGDGVDTTRRCALRPFRGVEGLTVPGRRRTAVEVEDLIGGLEQESSLWELDDPDKAPLDPKTGEWLFDFEAVELVRVPGRLY